MKKAVLIIAAFGCFLSSGCRDGYSGYSSYHPLTTYTAPNTSAGGVQGYFGTTNQIVPTYNYGYSYPYGYKYYYSNNPYNYRYGYYYNYYTPYYSPRVTYYNGGHCDAGESKLNLAIESSDGNEKRSLSGENLRAQTFGKRTEVEYGSEGEKINFLADEKGNTYVSGKVLVDGELKKIDPKNQKCISSRSKSVDDPDSEIATFNCTGDMKITAQALIPADEQHLSLKYASNSNKNK